VPPKATEEFFNWHRVEFDDGRGSWYDDTDYSEGEDGDEDEDEDED
jgi:hypothetical protein